MRIFMLMFILTLTFMALQACTSDPAKYELNSPCVSADSDSGQMPCTRRPIVGNRVG